MHKTHHCLLHISLINEKITRSEGSQDVRENQESFMFKFHHLQHIGLERCFTVTILFQNHCKWLLNLFPSATAVKMHRHWTVIFTAVWNPNLNLFQFVCLSISRGFYSFNIFRLKWVINILPTKIAQLIQQQNTNRNKSSIQLVFILRETEHKFSWPI